MAASADGPLDRETVLRALGSCRLGRPLELHDTIDSTNERARRLGRQRKPHGTLVCAEHQAAGRGRRGRVWESRPGGLYASLLLRPPEPIGDYGSALQLAAGLAVVEAVEPYLERPVELLWPNDCLIGHAKVAGVLVEGESGAEGIDFLVCGIGVNVNQSDDDFPSSLKGAATSLRLQAGRTIDRAVLLGTLMEAFSRWEETARREGPAAVASRWERHSPTAHDHDVEVETVDGVVRGRSAGLGPHGGLRVDRGGRIREIVLGELIRVRRRA